MDPLLDSQVGASVDVESLEAQLVPMDSQSDDPTLFARIKARIVADLGMAHQMAAPIAAHPFGPIEEAFGHPLPPLLKRLYSEVANGGFGPGQGLLCLLDPEREDSRFTALGIYSLYRRPVPGDSAWSWPEGLLPICHWGCAVYSCIDCRAPEFTMMLFDPNQHAGKGSWADAFFPDMRHFSEWMSEWADGGDEELLMQSSGMDGIGD